MSYGAEMPLYSWAPAAPVNFTDTGGVFTPIASSERLVRGAYIMNTARSAFYFLAPLLINMAPGAYTPPNVRIYDVTNSKEITRITADVVQGPITNMPSGDARWRFEYALNDPLGRLSVNIAYICGAWLTQLRIP